MTYYFHTEILIFSGKVFEKKIAEIKLLFLIPLFFLHIRLYLPEYVAS